MNFMNLPKKYSGKESKYLVLPIAYEGKMTSGTGAKKGPKEIVKASYQLEYYDEMFDIEPYEAGINLLPEMKFSKLTPEKAMDKISKEVKKHKDKFLISIGGDHSTTIGVLKGLEARNDSEFSLISFDAHADMFDSWNGSKYNHRCVNKYASYKHDVAILGVRSLDKDEADTIKGLENVHCVYAHEDIKQRIFDILPKLKQNVYVSIDVDFFDPSFIRNTGTPEPGGLLWNEFISILKIIFDAKNVISADIVEYSPNKDSEAESYSLAKLIYKIIAMKEFY
jgi:agmatinase